MYTLIGHGISDEISVIVAADEDNTACHILALLCT